MLYHYVLFIVTMLIVRGVLFYRVWSIIIIVIEIEYDRVILVVTIPE